ncbi:MAG: ornithine carbamoyltransferase [Candidatus Omnitrophica bacterium]|nr:ornithine carbamoyltransferase [Candidatus Omnitrophota bacterium]
MNKDLISIGEMSRKEILDIFSLTEKIKKSPGKYSRALKGKSLALIFEKPSNRTYVSFSVGMYQLGGNAIYLGPEQIKLGVRETIHDVAQTLSRYVDGIVLRTFGHENVLEMAKFADIPVINGLSDYSHPCQALADVFTIREHLGDTFEKITMAYIGDGNNVCNSLIFISSKLGMHFNIATPRGYEPDESLLKKISPAARETKARIRLCATSEEAAKDADVIYTDVWASMGQEREAEKRKQDFKDYQVNDRLVGLAKKSCIVMHCLPAHRGEEITDSAIDGKNSAVFDQAENRLHVQKAILVTLLKRLIRH